MSFSFPPLLDVQAGTLQDDGTLCFLLGPAPHLPEVNRTSIGLSRTRPGRTPESGVLQCEF